MTIYGPDCVVMIRSGNYAYACVYIDKPVHLIAGNNIGKTTLISALQFLYVDDSRLMHFPKDWEQTKRHYFPHPNSFVLFECMTPSGRQVVGVHGTGPGDGFKYKRFAYLGPFERTDFFDGDTLRRLEDIHKRLADRGFVYLDKQAFKASLLGGRGDKTRSISIVPLRDASKYETFRFLLANLLRLSAIDQQRLRKVLVDACRAKLQRPEIDLQGDFASLHTTAVRQSNELAYMRHTALPLFQELSELLVRRTEKRAKATSTWGQIQGILAVLRAEIEDLRSTRDQAALKQESEIERLEDKAQILSNQRDKGLRDEDHCKNRLAEIERKRVASADVVPELEEAACRQAQEALEESIARLGSARKADPARVRVKIREATRQLESDERLLRGLSNTLIAWLRRNSNLTSEQLDRVLSLTSKRIAAAQLGEDGIVIHDSERIVKHLSNIADRFDADGYADETISISAKILAGESVLSECGDPTVIEARVATAKAELHALESTLKDIEEQEALRKLVKAYQADILHYQARLSDFRDYQELRGELPGLSAEAQRLRDECAALLKEYNDVRAEIEAGKSAVQTLSNELDGKLRTLDRHMVRVGKLSAPPGDWGDERREIADSSAIEEAIDSYQRAWSEEHGIDTKCQSILAKLSSALPFIQGSTEADGVRKLAEELKHLDQKQKAVDEYWRSLIASLSGALRLMREDVERVGKEVRSLNARINARTVSNLRAVELGFRREDKLFRHLEVVEGAFSMPLFVDEKHLTAASDSLRTFFETYPKLSVEQLFDVHFAVTDSDEKIKYYESLDRIESMGTSVTIKVLVHLALVRMLLDTDEVRLPFFLDEIGTIDDDNLSAIVDCARGAGFVPILASIDHARECVDYLYTIDGEKGSLLVDDGSLHRLRRNDGA